MKRSISVFVFLLFTALLMAETIIPAGAVQGTWDQSGSPYRITGNLTVSTGTALFIEEGVDVIFDGTFRIDISGRIVTSGTEANPITITAQDTLNGWSGIRFNNSGGIGTLPSSFSHTHFSYGKAIWGASGTDPLNYGGAIWASNAGTLSFDNCVFYRCKSLQDGSAIYAQNNSSLIMTNCILKICDSGFFGGVIVKNGAVNISKTLFEGNFATTFGAGIYVYECAEANVISCRFIDNSAGAVTGIYSYESPLVVVNSLFVNNTTTMGMGGGIGAIFGSLVTNNCTFYQNTSALGGGAIWVNSLPSPAISTNCVFWANAPTAIALTASSMTHQYCSLQEDEGDETNILGDPLFADAATGIYSLASDSPCIDAGSPEITGLMLPDLDLNDNPRVVDGDGDEVAKVDIGCYEWQPLTTGTISGQVVDFELQVPIQGALIQVDSYSTITDAEGYFSLVLPAGNYILSCTADDFMDYFTDELVLPAGGSITLTIQMNHIVSNEDEHSPAISSAYAYPNPFRQSTEILWPQKNTLKVEVFNTRGQLIRQYADPAQLGAHRLNWDGRDQTGQKVSSGIYYCRISFDFGFATTKLVLLR